MICSVYHICRESDKFDFTKGYIGVSVNPEYRWNRHKKYEKTGRLIKVYKKYTDIIEYILFKGTREYCLFMEKVLRPTPKIGWNFVEGGGDPPNHLGKVMSDSQKRNISIANSGINGPNWKGWWIIEGVTYETTKDVSKVYGVTTKTVCNRVKSHKFPFWEFKKKE